MIQSSLIKNQSDVFVLTEVLLNDLKHSALNSSLHRARINIHRSDSAKVQEMIIALTNNCLFQPHRHIEKSESFHLIEGELLIMLFNDNGQLHDLIGLSEMHSNIDKMFNCRKGVYYRLDSSRWHSVLPLTPYVVFHETTNGPFVQGQHTFANFCPQEEKQLRLFYWDALIPYFKNQQRIKDHINEIFHR